MKFRKMILEIPAFHWTMEVVFTNSVVEYAKREGWQGGRNEVTTRAVTLFYDQEMKNVIIYQCSAEAGTIAHESWHAVRRMLVHVGAELENEVVAYHLGHLVQQTTLFKNSPRRKKKSAKAKKKVDKKKKS